MNRCFYQQMTSRLMIVIGLVLILINALGYVLGTNVVEENDGHLSGAIQGYSYPTQDTLRLQGMLDKPMDSFDIDSVNNTIFESIIHSDKRKIHFYENWMLWLGGKFYEPLSRTQNPRRIVLGGGAICSEVSAVFNSIANLNGFEARFVGLSGHVVSEIRTDNGWRVVDPDFGVTYPVGLKSLEKKEGINLMRELLTNRGFKAETIDQYIQLFQSSSDNIVTEVGVPWGPRLYAIELTTEYLKWIIPIIIIILGIVLLRKTHNNRIHSDGNSATLHSRR